MSNEKISFPKVTTKAGRAGYMYLSKPDTKFKEEGEYRAEVVLTAADAADLIEKIDAQMEVSLAKAKKENPGKRIKSADVPYREQDDGTVKFSFKCPAFVTSKKTNERYDMKPAIFDAGGNRINNADCKAGGGSTIRVSGELRPYFTALVGAGVSLRLKAVQIIKLVEYGGGGGSAEGFGFDTEEGYVADTPRSAAEQAGFDSDDDVDF